MHKPVSDITRTPPIFSYSQRWRKAMSSIHRTHSRSHNEKHVNIAGRALRWRRRCSRRRGGRPLSPISPVAFLRLHAELLHELSLRRGRRGREEVEISSRDIRVHEPSRARCNCEGGGWVARGGGAGGANAQVQLVSWPQGDVSDKSCLGPGPFCAAGPRRQLKLRRRVQESRCRQRAASWLADGRTDGQAVVNTHRGDKPESILHHMTPLRNTCNK